MRIYAVYPDADAPERCCNAIAESEDHAVVMVIDTGRFPMGAGAYAVPVDESCLTRKILSLEDDRLSIKDLIRSLLASCADYAAIPCSVIHRVDAWSWDRAERKIHEAVIRYEIDRYFWRRRRRFMLMRLRRMYDFIMTVRPVMEVPSQDRGEAEEPEEEV